MRPGFFGHSGSGEMRSVMIESRTRPAAIANITSAAMLVPALVEGLASQGTGDSNRGPAPRHMQHDVTKELKSC